MSHTTTVTLLPQTGKTILARSQDEIYTIDDLIRRRASELQDAPLLCYPREGLVDYEEHSAVAIDRFVDAAVAALQQRGLQPVVCSTKASSSRRHNKSETERELSRSLDAMRVDVSFKMLGEAG
jgi:hypothetical protein